MASFACKFNKTSFGIDTTDFKFVKLADLYKEDPKKVHVINGMYVHKSQLGDSPVAICSDAKQLVNMPSHLTETVREVLADGDAIQAIKDGKVGFTIYDYESHGKKCYSMTFVDL